VNIAWRSLGKAAKIIRNHEFNKNWSAHQKLGKHFNPSNPFPSPENGGPDGGRKGKKKKKKKSIIQAASKSDIRKRLIRKAKKIQLKRRILALHKEGQPSEVIAGMLKTNHRFVIKTIQHFIQKQAAEQMPNLSNSITSLYNQGLFPEEIAFNLNVPLDAVLETLESLPGYITDCPQHGEQINSITPPEFVEILGNKSCLACIRLAQQGEQSLLSQTRLQFAQASPKYSHPSYLKVIELCSTTKLSLAEIARMTGVSSSTVRRWCYEAKVRFPKKVRSSRGQGAKEPVLVKRTTKKKKKKKNKKTAGLLRRYRKKKLQSVKKFQVRALMELRQKVISKNLIEGLSFEQIAAEMNIHVRIIKRLCSYTEVLKKNDQLRDQVLAMHSQGHSLKEIAETLQIPGALVYYWINF
jgi:DNA-directed RNA polymerase specialized sigma24 family protein